MAQNSRDQVGAVAYAVLRTPRILGVSARPIVKVEVLDEDTRGSKNLAWALMGGVNLDFKAPLRLLLQAEQVVPEKLSTLPREFTVYVQLALDVKTGLATLVGG